MRLAVLLLSVEPWVVVAVAAGAAFGGWLAVVGIDVQTDPSKAVRRSPDRPLGALLGGFSELRNNVDMAVIIG